MRSQSCAQQQRPPFDEQAAWKGSPSDSTVALIYEVDEDRDGKADRLFILEESDTLAMSESDEVEVSASG